VTVSVNLLFFEKPLDKSCNAHICRQLASGKAKTFYVAVECQQDHVGIVNAHSMILQSPEMKLLRFLTAKSIP
jgi:hypothetical protein